jgi:uncharacterized protein (TIGR02099 family)
MLKSFSLRVIWPGVGWLARLIVVFSAAMAVLTALAIILLRYWILPDIGQYHDKITASLSKAIGNTVTIGRIEGDWQGLQPRLTFSDVLILDEQRQPALALPRIDSSLSWMSLLTAELRLANLEIDRPELLIRRDSQGRIFIGHVMLSKQGTDHNLADWLLRQSHMVVRDALIAWVDEQRAAPPLVLRQVNLHVDSLFSRHRFALRALPPEDLAGPMDVRGDFRGASFADLGRWKGQIYTQLDFTDVMVWRHWLDLPSEVTHGHGALRSWLSIEGGSVTGITADMILDNLVARLGEGVPEMALANLRGRIAWESFAGGFEVSTRKLAMRFHDGVEFPPTDLFLRLTKAGEDKPAGEVRANSLQLERLVSLARYLPLETEMRTRLEAYSPTGSVTNLNLGWQGALEKPHVFKIKGQFKDIGLRQVGAMPGFSGVSLDVDGNDEDGRLYVNSQQLVVDAPGVMREPLPFDILIGQASWQRVRDEFRITLANTAIVNDDLAGNLYGSYQTRAGSLGMLDLTASLTRGDVRRAARYTPLIALNKQGNDWLNGALLAGHTRDFRIRIKGNLSDFPVRAGNRNVLFEIGGHARGVVLEFHKNWPRIENIAGEFWIHGNKLEVKSPSASIMGAALRNVTVTMPDMMSENLPLEINGEAVGESNAFLSFIQQSPIRGYMGGFTDGMSVSGNGHLDLFLRIPLRDEGEVAQADTGEANDRKSARSDKQVKVSGTFRVQNNDINLGKGIPLLRKTHGELSFTESGMKTSGLSAEILGGGANINVRANGGGAVHATVQGHANLDALRKINPHPLLSYLHGGAEWDADIAVTKKLATLTINSSLQGIGSTLPQPFTKGAGEAMPSRFEKVDIAEGRDLATVRLGNLLDARLERRDKGGEMVIERGTVDFGDQGIAADVPKTKKRASGAGVFARSSQGNNGIWLAGSVPELSIQGWENLMSGEAEPAMDVPIAGATLHIGNLTGYGQAIKSLQIDAVKRGDGLAAQLASEALNGEVVWLPHGYEEGSKFSAHLSNLYWVKEEQHEPASAQDRPGGFDSLEPGTKAAILHPGRLPALEIAIENLQVKDRHFGRFDLVGHPDGNNWRLRRLNITNPDGSLAGDGVWSSTQENVQTQVNLQLKLSDVGKTLARYGYPNTIKGGSGKLAANLTWDGAPDDFNYVSLNGTLKLDTGKGRFLKMDPGAGKLFSILSLQALPSRITLDFTDVFSEGFQFDNINGSAAIKGGVITTDDFHIDGSAAKVTLKGSVNLNSATQDLRVKIFPTIGDSVSLISAFTAGPAIGVGTLIVSKVLGDPLDKLVSFEYNVSGTWSEPNVVKVVKEPVPYK